MYNQAGFCLGRKEGCIIRARNQQCAYSEQPASQMHEQTFSVSDTFLPCYVWGVDVQIMYNSVSCVCECVHTLPVYSIHLSPPPSREREFIHSSAAAPSMAATNPPWTFLGTAAFDGAEVLCALAEAEVVRLAVAEEREEALELRLLDALAEDSLAEEALALALEAELEELAEALAESLAEDSDAEDADADADAEAEAEEAELAAVEAASEAVLVAPWTWKPPLKLYSLGFSSSMIWTKTWPTGTLGGMVKVALPVLGMLEATMMPSLGWMSPLVWILMVMVLEREMSLILGG
jgi:hypothetical protein